MDNRDYLRRLAETIVSGNESTQHSAIVEEAYNSILLEYKSGGSSGGNCYGDRSTSYYCDTSEKIDSIDNNVLVYLSKDIDFNESKYKSLVYNSIDSGNTISTYTDGGDYYGNYAEYETTSISLEDFVECFNDQNDAKVFLEVFEEVAVVKQRELLFEQLNNKVVTLGQEKEKVQKSIQNHQAEMEQVKAEQLKEKKNLENKLVQINRALENSETNSKKIYKQKENHIASLDVLANINQEKLEQLKSDYPELVKTGLKRKY